MNNKQYPENMPAIIACDEQIKAATDAIRTRTEALCGEIAQKSAPARPGEGPYDIATNDQTDLSQGAEEMRLLLGYLYPERRAALDVREAVPANRARNAYPPPEPIPPVLSVQRTYKGSDSPHVKLVLRGATFHTVRTTLFRNYDPDDDVLTEPRKEVIHFLKQHTAPEAVKRLQQFDLAAITLFDNYVHDSRCWFRVPYFREYAPGGYGWPRVIFIGGDERADLFGFDPLCVALCAAESDETAME